MRIVLRSAFLFSLPLLLLALVGGTGHAQATTQGDAQACGIDCVSCGAGTNAWVGQGTCMGCHGIYRTDYCQYNTCLRCQLSQSDGVSAHMIAVALNDAETAALPAVVREYGGRMAISGTRGFVAIKGGCDQKGLQVIVFIQPSKAAALKRLGVKDLKEFLEAPPIT